MKNEENINNKNFQAQKILGKAVTWWECRKAVVYFLGIVHVLIPHSLRHFLTTSWYIFCLIIMDFDNVILEPWLLRYQ